MKRILFLIFIIITLFCKASYSQTDTSGDKNNREIRKIVKEKLMQKLDTDEKTINSYLLIYADYRKKISELNKQKAALTKYIEDSPDAADISQKMDDLLDTLTKITEARKDFVDKSKKVLTPQQLAKAIIFQKKLRKMMQGEQMP